MKIDRVLFCLNNNKNYTDFWNLNSKIWKTKFNIKPTLFYVGDKEEILQNNLSPEFGEIIILPKFEKDICNGSLRQWYITWALFYGATFFEDEVCITSGVDQIPLSSIFLEKILHIDEDKYIIGFADAYNRKDLFPSSHHVAKGKLFKNKYNILNNWFLEIERIYRYKFMFSSKDVSDDYWGLDEAFSSNQILKNLEHVYFLNNFFHPIWVHRRIDRGFGLNYNAQLLKNGWYSELHSPRPYSQFKTEIDRIINIAHGI